ncbi:MAG: class IV adenylate cyclase [Phycisphaeraceae bacterium]|nr:class IV adenylate cyclase [Phycisphaeraceae bacterium]
MSLEIEAKIAVSDLAAVELQLQNIKAVRGKSSLEVNTFFDTYDGALKSTDQGLRIRVCRPLAGRGRKTATITHKGPRAQGIIKSREETEVEISDPAAAAELLGRLGFVKVFSFEKRRLSWTLDNCQVELDTLPYLGHFVEVEGPTEQAVISVLARLSLSSDMMVHASYISMLMTYATEHRLSNMDIVFDSAADAPAR